MNTLPKRIAVIGLDHFGSNIARTLSRNGFEVAGLDPLRSHQVAPCEGFKLLRNLEQAIDSSDVVITCFPDQLLMNARLCSPEATFGLHGKALISFNTAQTRSAASARSMGEWARSEQIDYLEVSLNSQAEAIGQLDCGLLCCGSLKAYQKLQPLCRTLGAMLTYLGSDCGATLEG
ncbi:NAD(P)-binding domain-containing protein [Pseudomonas putida]|uniref:NAD(P)-binding domain-containing protein n=1 Tax=Pseudomonas putida TaxID=303 RepID=UPI0006482C1D|nr:NAD(P)-binding domain-containing protein [Pseudomonas putida]